MYRDSGIQSPGQSNSSPLWRVMILAALAGGLGWGIRGQYGHETGAMIAGVLVGFVLVLSFCSGSSKLFAIRAVGLCTVAIGFGGSMTYGQTIGLTQDAPLIGNWSALLWGMLGLAIKGGIWIGFAGTFLGMGLGGIRYGQREMFLLMIGLVALAFVGVWILNSPFDPSNKKLPLLYFSDSWNWEPNADLKPRREVWGGLGCSLAGLILYTQIARRDPLALRLGLWGILGGAIGFPLGQSLQAFHAWNLEFFRNGVWSRIDPQLNWWNLMETTFGAVMGATLALGLWLNRARISNSPQFNTISQRAWMEWTLISMHVCLLVAAEFLEVPLINQFYDFGLILGLIPIVGVASGRFWPCLLVLPITLLPIGGKTVRKLVYEDAVISPGLGWLLYFVIPMLIAVMMATRESRASTQEDSAGPFLARGLLVATWSYFLLNFAFFRFPWPWERWTNRTPNAVIFTTCALVLTLFAARRLGGRTI